MILTFALVAMVALAVPAKRGVWKTLTMADGTEVRAQLVGDERLHYWLTEDGQRLVGEPRSDRFVAVSQKQLAQRAMRRTTSINKLQKARQQKLRRKAAFTGTKRGLVILAQYSDVKFQSAHNKALYENIMNKEGYTDSNGFQGSVRDYFKAQSGGVFDLQFDVVGPVTLSKAQSYYGSNDDNGEDEHAAEMVAEACQLADAQGTDFSQYDWTGDGEVDQVYVVYAGKGEADSGVEETIWPHEYSLSDAAEYGDGSGALTLDGVKVDTYACGSEVDAYNHIEGIGTFCHEFSHCLGYPDMYDTDYAGYFGMGDLDLMCSGSYNGDGFVPAGYTAWEKWTAGWLEPTELSDEDVAVENLKAISEGGGAYVIYNQAHKDEYYLVENRQKTGWDRELPAKGLMVTHVDYDAELFANNIVNTVYPYKDAYADAYDYYSYYVELGYITEDECTAYCEEYAEAYANDYERMTIFHADNDDDRKYWREATYSYSKTTTTTDLYPYLANDSLTNFSRPAATLHNANKDGSFFMNRGITAIRQNTDGTMSFQFLASVAKKEQGDFLFYESFDQCDGKGGNDGAWSGQVANGTFSPDNEGWESEKSFGADQCAKFGTGSVVGEATTPAIQLTGESTLTFMAGAWNANADKTTLNVTVTGGTIEPSTFTIAKGSWTSCEAKVTGTGTVRVTFTSAGGRFFLDEVKLSNPSGDGVISVNVDVEDNNAIYDLAGRRVVNPKKGLYIIGGRKVIVR